jgi:hypothetical protein
MSEGRGLGLTFFVASQRPQKVHNDTLDNCETLIAMRVTHPRSRDAAEEWINAKGDKEFGKKVLASLSELKRGEAWVWSPENDFGPERVQFPMFETFDSFAPPQLQKKVSQAGWSEVDLDQVKQKLATVIAEAKANDPKELKTEIVRLKQELAKKPAPTATHKAAPVVDEKAIDRAVKTATVPLLRQIENIRKQAKRAIDELTHVTGPLSAIANLPAPEIPSIPIAPSPAPLRVVPAPRQAKPTQGNSQLGNAEQKILDQLAELEAMGIPEPEKPQLGMMAGYTNVRSGGFSEPMGALIEKGLARYPRPGYVALTDAGRTEARPVDVPVTTDELHARLCQTLGGAEAKILREIISIYPEAIGKEELGMRLNYTNVRSGGFSEPIGRLRSLGIVDYPEKGIVRAADWLFLDAALSARA